MSNVWTLKRYIPWIGSILLHVLFFILMIAAFAPRHYQLPGALAGKQVIEVSSLSQKTIDQRLQRIKTVKAKRQAAIKRAVRLRQVKARQRAKQRALLIAKKKATLKKKYAQQQQALAAKLRQQQLQQERTMMAALQEKTAEKQAIINKYIPQILMAIRYQWYVPAGADRNNSCQFLIDLAPGGIVLSVKLLKSSGNAALDHSAQQAVWQASPLPVPQNTAIFKQLRQIRLTMRPEKVTQVS